LKTSEFKKIYAKHHLFSELININLEKGKFHLQGLNYSATPLLLSALFSKKPDYKLIILPSKEEAAYFFNDLTNLLGEEKSLFFPSSYRHSAVDESGRKEDSAGIVLRTEVLSKYTTNEPFILVSHPTALLEKVITKKSLEENTLQISVGEKISIEFIIEVLNTYNFQRIDFVYEPGQFSVRGSIVDIFSYSSDNPYRLDFFGDEVESIRVFDTVTQLSQEKKNVVTIVPNIQNRPDEELRVSIFEYIPQSVQVWCSNLEFVKDKMNDLYKKRAGDDQWKWCSGDETVKLLNNFTFFEFDFKSLFPIDKIFNFQIEKQNDFAKNFDLLSEDIFKHTEQGFQIFILSDNNKQFERLQAIFDAQETSELLQFTPMPISLNKGFIDNDLKICFYTDHEIFQRYKKYKLKTEKQLSSRETLTIKELTDLQPGDYVVHVDHGIGRFGGLQKIEVNGKMQETIRLIYMDNDVLLVSLQSLHKISKFKSKDGAPPKIYKLGSAAWSNLKNRAKSKVKDIAKELIALYALRKTEKGFAFGNDTYLQHALESSFIYEDTPDQLQATIDTKADMESDTPMDRLICGDVGFGKTEIAIRAAFKAVADSKQVAVLVPTTILAFQHFNTFSARLKGLPCNVDYVSRLKPAKNQKETLQKVKEGKVDILIGTHRIISKDVQFRDLGLLIVDEEQKFGVGVKEKLKHLKVNVDTLTLTATPIPRTLQFSLMGARDLSIIRTAPPNRYPIITEVHTFNEKLIRDAINFEVDRNGQVFIINNRIQNIYQVEDMVNRLCPNVRTVVGHGQMDGSKLEKIMLGFINQEFDVLIATTIIESGLDIPNANTIIINDANKFGLSDLHQLRGRVGRSNKKAFCYLLAPPLDTLTGEARRRLQAIEEFSELGSGFNIALQDLDIRGAGNILGAEQSGYISDIGYETFQRILDEAILELRENEFSKFFSDLEVDNETDKNGEEKKDNKLIRKSLVAKHISKKFVTDCQIDTDLELLFPDAYIENIAERLKLYRELDNMTNEDQLQTFENEVTDRFGKLPQQSSELIYVVRLRWLAMDYGMEKIVLKINQLICYFVNNSQSPFYDSPNFQKVMQFAAKNPKISELKNTKGKLILKFSNVSSIENAYQILLKISMMKL